VALGKERPGSTVSLPLTAVIVRVEPHGHEAIVTLDAGGFPLTARVGKGRSLVPGESVAVRLELGSACWFDAATGARLEAPPAELG
jgi:multiple sugar transport system ATP-binding protein